MISASAGWVAEHQKTLLPETFIEIAYTVSEPGLQEDAAAAASDEEPFSQVAQVVEMSNRTSEKYATLEHGFWGLDGSFTYFDGTPVEPGYVTKIFSGKNSTFEVEPKITISFSQLHIQSIPGITITWSETFTEWAEEFRVTAYADTNIVAERTVTENTSPVSAVWMNLENYNLLEIEILKWSHPGHRARCMRVAMGIRTFYTKQDLLGYEHTQSADLLSATLPKNTITFRLRNENGQWNPDNPQNAVKYLLDQQEIRVRYGLEVEGQTEWIDGGVFWLDEWNTPSNGLEASFTARDEFTFLNDVYAGPLSGTLYEFAEAALRQGNLPALSTGADAYYLSPILRQYTADVSNGAIQDATLSEVLQMVAHAGNCVLYQDRLGTIHIEPWNASYSGYRIEPAVSYTHPEYTISKPLKAVSVGYGPNDSRAVISSQDVGEIQTVDNPMILLKSDAQRVGERAKEVLEHRKVISGEFRADVRLDVLDPIIVTSKYASNVIAVTDVSYSTTGGGFRGKYTGRVVSIHLEPEDKRSGEIYAGES